jgi:hypothetical protein
VTTETPEKTETQQRAEEVDFGPPMFGLFMAGQAVMTLGYLFIRRARSRWT